MLKFSGSTKVALICLVLCLSTLTDARKAAGSKRGGSSKYGSGSRVSKPAQTQQQAPSYANPNIAQLSYSPGQQSAPMRPSAPVDSSANKPVGWNVGHETPAVAANKPPVNSAPYPTNNQFPQAPPPSYSQYPNQHGNVNGPPPPYSAQPQPGLQSRFNEAPPAYSPHQPNPGYPVQQPGLGQPGYGQQGFGQPGVGGYPGQGGAGAYPVQQQGFGQPGLVPGAGQPPTIVNNYHGAPQGGNTGGGLSGLQTGLLAGTAGLALYGALKPSGEKTVIINNTVIQEVPANVTEMAHNATAVETTPVPLAAYPSTGVPASSEMVPLAPMNPSTGLYPALPSAASPMTPECNGTDCPMMMASSPAPEHSSEASVPVSSQFPSSLAPLTTFAAMANDAATSNMTSVPVAVNPTMVPSSTSTAAVVLPPLATASEMPAMANTSHDLQQAALLNSNHSNSEPEKQRDSGSNTVRMSFVSLIVLPLVWVSVY